MNHDLRAIRTEAIDRKGFDSRTVNLVLMLMMARYPFDIISHGRIPEILWLF
jgi:hypothetical protein